MKLRQWDSNRGPLGRRVRALPLDHGDPHPYLIFGVLRVSTSLPFDFKLYLL